MMVSARASRRSTCGELVTAPHRPSSAPAARGRRTRPPGTGTAGAGLPGGAKPFGQPQGGIVVGMNRRLHAVQCHWPETVLQHGSQRFSHVALAPAGRRQVVADLGAMVHLPPLVIACVGYRLHLPEMGLWADTGLGGRPMVIVGESIQYWEYNMEPVCGAARVRAWLPDIQGLPLVDG